MFADIGRHMPQEFDGPLNCLNWCKNKELGLSSPLLLTHRDKESITIKFPLTNEVIPIYGEEDEILWLYENLITSFAFQSTQEVGHVRSSEE